ncbi:hypothetical protein RFI_20145 [Reticulomyxa filosa]|uniref:Kelch motif family protein n=1 Tax=Reticulomyxa filosa TaxID=46433 RepID=X6MVQ5_RETFI|nr:hypothetical protein RFI_20145 [Reticulomyxa filosa]|eukprot:ETO17185.1 hypothetical protein RFI_20145 [Reticulomyxa filosa]
MLLSCKDTVLSIEYDEDNNNFQFYQLPVCDDIASFNCCAYVYINDAILFFGGWNGTDVCSKLVYKYSIRESKWMIFKNTLPSALYHRFAILNEEDNIIHIIGGQDDKYTISQNEIKFINQYWIRTLKIKLGWIDDFDQIIIKYIRQNKF